MSMAVRPSLQNLALFLPEVRELLVARDFVALRKVLKEIHPVDLAEGWGALSESERIVLYQLLDGVRAVEVFEELGFQDQSFLIQKLNEDALTQILHEMASDDRAGLFTQLSDRSKKKLLALMRKEEVEQIRQAQNERPGTAGALMSRDFIELKKEMTARQALAHVQACARIHKIEDFFYLYVTEDDRRLIGQVGLRSVIGAPPDILVREIMFPVGLIKVRHDADQEDVARLFSRYDLISTPVVDGEGRILGVITVDDVVDVIHQEATEDIIKIGGVEALDTPYLSSPFWQMIRRRAGWLSALFLGEMLTATAMGYFQDEISRAVVLALFMPLIISSGGNSGSQATTLVIRAMALGEVRLRDWWRVSRREIASGLVLGSILGTIGFLRIMLWHAVLGVYGSHFLLVGFTVSASLIGVVIFGTLTGSLLPFILRRLGYDPASASAPFVATLVDVTGLIIYFTIASVILRGTLL